MLRDIKKFNVSRNNKKRHIYWKDFSRVRPLLFAVWSGFTTPPTAGRCRWFVLTPGMGCIIFTKAYQRTSMFYLFVNQRLIRNPEHPVQEVCIGFGGSDAVDPLSEAVAFIF